MAHQVLYLAFAALIYLAIKHLNSTDMPKIKNLPEIPGVPLFGNLLQLGSQHATVAAKWAENFGPVFQVRLGNRRIVFVNSYAAVRHFWITHQSSLISRPLFHTYHAVVATSQGLTIGTSPWDESCKRKRKAAGTALNRPAVASYMPVLDLESAVNIRELWVQSRRPGSGGEVDPRVHLRRFALNTTLAITYGFRIDDGIDSEFLKEIFHVEKEIVRFRSTSNNWQDYIPLLRLWAPQNTRADEYRRRRDQYLTGFLESSREKVKRGTDEPCIAGNILKNPESKVQEAELKSIFHSMVSAGSDTMAANLMMGLASLCTPEGRVIQAKAYHAIQEAYPDGDAWQKCLVEEKVPYMKALVKEILRFWTVIPICLPRRSIRDIPYKGVVIPAGTTFFMNAYAADYDETHFPEPMLFNPDRFLHDSSDCVTGTPHYAFGAGSRMCIAAHLASRELYTTFARLITAFEILPPLDRRDAPVMDAIQCNATPGALSTDPKPFKVGLRARDSKLLESWISEAEARSSSL